MNPLSAADVKFINRIDDNTVEFGINLIEFPYLADPHLLTACMNQFAFMYSQTVTGWQAFIERGLLRIIVTGKVRWDNFIPKENNE